MAAADEGEGKSRNSFQEALEDAWEDAKKKPGNTPGEYEVKKTVVVTENPIREYRVTIKKA
jgi:flavin-binding protein dodecin